MGEQAVHLQEDIENGMNGEEHENSDEDMSENEDDMSQEEFEALSNQMDELNSALDTIEERNDNIYAELLKLLQENREIREQMKGNVPPSNKGPEESATKS